MSALFKPPGTQVHLEKVKKSYTLGRETYPVLDLDSFAAFKSEFIVVSGPSGSGKSTLLNILGCIDNPDEGQVEIAGRDISSMSTKEQTDFRAESIGFIFQSFNLLPVLTALENVEYPLRLSVRDKSRRQAMSIKALERVGLGEFINRKPGELSGGQRQRVAIARAIVKTPAIIIADEPTANLDAETADSIISLLNDLRQQDGATLICSSHDPKLMSAADRIVTLTNGRLQTAVTQNQNHFVQESVR